MQMDRPGRLIFSLRCMRSDTREGIPTGHPTQRASLTEYLSQGGEEDHASPKMNSACSISHA